MTNWEKYFGTPERAAKSMIPGKSEMVRAFTRWSDADGALLCALVGRGNGKQERMETAYLEWLNSEATE